MCIVILSSHIVSDIETIADEVAVMQNGKLIAKGIQSEIIDHAEGKVFEMLVDNTKLGDLKARQLIINIIKQKDQSRIRYISKTGNPEPGSTSVKATLEDAYLFLTQNKA